jgi:hypothetical protein
MNNELKLTTYRVYKRFHNINHYHNDIGVETLERKPDIKTVLWFSVADGSELIAHVDNPDRVASARKGVLSTAFRKIQSDLFKQYFNLTDSDDVPYRH